MKAQRYERNYKRRHKESYKAFIATEGSNKKKHNTGDHCCDINEGLYAKNVSVVCYCVLFIYGVGRRCLLKQKGEVVGDLVENNP